MFVEKENAAVDIGGIGKTEVEAEKKAARIFGRKPWNARLPKEEVEVENKKRKRILLEQSLSMLPSFRKKENS